MAATEFNDAQHYGIFTTAASLTSQTGKMVRQSELVLAALRAQGVFDNLIDSTTAPAHDKLWLDKNSDPAVLKEWDSVSSTWQAMTFDRMFGRAVITEFTNVGGTANAITVDEPSTFIDNRIYGLVPASSNTGATTVQVTGVGTYDVVYPNGDDIVDGELVAGFRTPLLFTNGRFEVVFGANAGSVKRAETDASGFSFTVDEDDMASNSDTLLPTQQSVKAYVDVITGPIDSGGSSWTSGKAPAVIQRAIPKFLTPEMYIGLETQIIYAPAGNPIDVSGATDFSVAFDAMRAEMLTLIEDVEWPSGFNWKRHKFGIGLQPGHRYRVDSPINFTGFQTRGLVFNGGGAQIFGNMNAGPVIDLIGSAGWSIRDLCIEADNSASHNPDIGIMFGRNVASQVCEGFSMDRVRVDGWFRKAGVYNYGSELFNAQGLHVISYMQDAPAFWIDSRNTLDIADYTAMSGTLADAGDDASCIQHTFIGGALRNIQENQYGCLRIDSTRDADLNRVRGIKLINTYFTNNGTDTDTVRPAVYIRGPVDGFHYDGHSELSTPTDSIVNLSHLLYLDVTDAANPAVFHDYKIREFFSDAEIAVVGRSNNTANLHLIDWDIGIGYSRGAYPSGTPAKLFGSNFTSSNTRYVGKISTGDVDATFLNVDSVLFDGIIQTEEALPNVGLSLGSRAWIQTANASSRGYFKQASKNVSSDGSITVDGYEIINLTGSVKAVSFASNTRFHRFAVANSTSNFVVISGLTGANKILPPGATANIVQNGTSFFAENARIAVVLDESAAKVDLTGSTSETTLKTITIPAKAMGANGSVRVTLLASANNNANTKTLRVKFGGTTFHQTNLTTQLSRQAIVIVRNRNSESSQVGNPVAFDGIGAASAAVITASVDTTADVTMLITGQLANSGDDMHLEGYAVEVLPAS